MQFVLPLPTDAKIPVYRQVSEALRDAILTGRLKPGERLPSTRDLAESIKVSRFTVIRSYEELASQGYIQTTGGSGTFVNPDISRALKLDRFDPGPERIESTHLSTYGRRVCSERIEPADAELFEELNYGAPALDQIPLNRWREMLYRSTRFQDADLVSYRSDPFGYGRLREAIAGYLTRSRSVNCTPDRIVIFSGAQSGLDLIGRLLIDEGDQVVVENPGFPGARRSLVTHGAEIVSVPVDEAGLVVDKLWRCDNAKLLYTTPSHHDPTGVVLSLPRRLEMLRWADHNNAFILEDDYDSEFRYGEKPVPSMQGLDQSDRVIYLSTFWKVLFPIVRIAFMVLPKRLVPAVSRAKSLIEREFPILEQRALADFINEGHLERHIKRTRAMYATRRAALVQALTVHMSKKITISPITAGMHLMIKFNDSTSERSVLTSASEANLSLATARNHYVSEAPGNEFLVGFAHKEEEELKQSVARFSQLLAFN